MSNNTSWGAEVAYDVHDSGKVHGRSDPRFVKVRLHNIGIYSTATRPARHRGTRSDLSFFHSNHDLFDMPLCVLSRISDMQDLGDRQSLFEVADILAYWSLP